MEEHRSLNVHNVERNIIDRVGYGATHHPTKIHRKEDGKETERELRKVGSSKEEQAETMSKEKVEERKENVSTKSHAEADTASWRDDDWCTADSNSPTSAAAEEFQHASVGDLRLSNLGFVKHTESFQHERLDPSQRTITFGIDTAACKTVVPANHPAARGYLVHKDSLHGCAYSTAGRDKVVDQGKRILCTPDETGKPMASGKAIQEIKEKGSCSSQRLCWSNPLTREM